MRDASSRRFRSTTSSRDVVVLVRATSSRRTPACSKQITVRDESSLTGSRSVAQEPLPAPSIRTKTQIGRAGFLRTSVVSGTGRALVTAPREDELRGIAPPRRTRTETDFQHGVRAFSLLIGRSR